MSHKLAPAREAILGAPDLSRWHQDTADRERGGISIGSAGVSQKSHTTFSAEVRSQGIWEGQASTRTLLPMGFTVGLQILQSFSSDVSRSGKGKEHLCMSPARRLHGLAALQHIYQYTRGHCHAVANLFLGPVPLSRVAVADHS